MAEPIDNPAYWAERLRHAVRPGSHLHHSIFRCPEETWKRIEDKHRMILARLIGPRDAVLDCGCGYGRLLTLMPPSWVGPYLGVDISEAFLREARERHDRLFMTGDLRDLSFVAGRYDWAVLISIRPMVRRNMGDEVWAAMEKEIRTKADQLLFLEYDGNDPGSVE